MSIRDLRNKGGEIVERAARGEPITITRDGKPMAELRPLPGPLSSAQSLLTRWHALPPVNSAALREDVATLLDPSL